MTNKHKITVVTMTGDGNDIPLTVDPDTRELIIYGGANTNMLDPGTPSIKLSMANRLIQMTGANLPGTVLHFDGTAAASLRVIEFGKQS